MIASIGTMQSLVWQFASPAPTAPSDVTNAQLFVNTNADQYFSVPADCTALRIRCWGASGAMVGHGAIGVYQMGSSGSGGYTEATFVATPFVGQTLTVIVGQGGISTDYASAASLPLSIYGGGGLSGQRGDTNWGAATGGGRSAVQWQNEDIITAGAGGAAGCTTLGPIDHADDGGHGGGLVGGDAYAIEPNYNGRGGTQTSGGEVAMGSAIGSFPTPEPSGKYVCGLAGQYGQGAGGGYYGGSGGSCAYVNGGFIFYGGGGGSSFVDALYGTVVAMEQGTSAGVPHDADLPIAVRGQIGNGIAATGMVNGAGQSGQPGCVLIEWR